jgi:hypothetical protein
MGSMPLTEAGASALRSIDQLVNGRGRRPRDAIVGDTVAACAYAQPPSLPRAPGNKIDRRTELGLLPALMVLRLSIIHSWAPHGHQALKSRADHGEGWVFQMGVISIRSWIRFFLFLRPFLGPEFGQRLQHYWSQRSVGQNVFPCYPITIAYERTMQQFQEGISTLAQTGNDTLWSSVAAYAHARDTGF